MRTRVALLLVLAIVPAFAIAAPAQDVREVVANRVMEPRCPGHSLPETVACFAPPAGAASVRVVAKPAVGNAEQPRMLVQLQNATALWHVRWMCEDGEVGFGGANVTQVVVTLHDDRAGCGDARRSLIARGTLTATFP